MAALPGISPGGLAQLRSLEILPFKSLQNANNNWRAGDTEHIFARGSCSGSSTTPSHRGRSTSGSSSPRLFSRRLFPAALPGQGGAQGRSARTPSIEKIFAEFVVAFFVEFFIGEFFIGEFFVALIESFIKYIFVSASLSSSISPPPPPSPPPRV